MRYTLKLNGVIVGHSELERADPAVGRAWGELRPGLGYDLVQPIFRLFARAVPQYGSTSDEALLDRYYKSRDNLPLALEDAAGRRIHTTTVHIADYTVEDGPRALVLDVLIDDDAYWANRE